MMLLQRLASTRLTLLGMVLLAIGAGLSYDNPASTSVWVLVAPLGFLALNLFAAIVVLPAINQRVGLLLFHIGLLSICILAAIGRLTMYEARIEMVNGAMIDLSMITDSTVGPWHAGDLESVRFIQGAYTVDYGPKLTRGPTRSHVMVPDGSDGWREEIVGDDTPLILDGYRFYTTFNKGFAVIVTWLPLHGSPITGNIHMPSYPLFEYKQDNEWTPPGGVPLKLWLRLNTGYTTEDSWILDGARTTGSLVVNDGKQRVELQPGEEVSLTGGSLRYEALTTWMGYKIFYDPTLRWLFIAAILGVCGLAYHYWKKFEDNPMKVVAPDAEEVAGEQIKGKMTEQ